VFGGNPGNALFTNAALYADARVRQRDDAQALARAWMVCAF
jgi:hypothetical protein